MINFVSNNESINYKAMATIMKGDFVKMIYTGEVGQVKGWVDGETLIVEMDGVEFPVFTDHIQKTEAPNASSSTVTKPSINHPKRAAEKLKAIGLNSQIDDLPDQGIHCLLQPFFDTDGDIKYFNIHLHNDTGIPISFSYTCTSKNQSPYSFSKEMGGRNSMIVHSLEFDQLNDKPSLEFSFKLLKISPNKKKEFSKVFKLKPKLVLQPTRHIAIVDAYVYCYTLFTQLPKNKEVEQPVKAINHELINTQLQLNQTISTLASKETNPTSETFFNLKERIVDLHMEQLAKTYGHLPKRHILAQQLKHFEDEIKGAITKREDHMIVIHGLGKGKLKQEIIKLLRDYEEVCAFRNDYDPRFGFGATKILFEYED